MATYQISKIQIRRGKATEGTGVPQLASGEMAWAIDTQELYIGNGSVSEGAPAVGNTRVLTQNDITANGGILNLLEYTYKKLDNSTTTGPNPTTPVVRSIQDRLDDFVSILDFASSTEMQAGDWASIIQRAINQLYLNTTTKASSDAVDGVRRRVALYFPAGKYQFSSTLLIPSYATLVGVGIDKTKLVYTGTASAFRFINDSSTAGNPDPVISTSNTQPRKIYIKQLTVVTSASAAAWLMNSVKDSEFEDLVLQGNWSNSFNESQGINLTATSSVVTSENNLFSNVRFISFKYPVFSQHDIRNNRFENCYFSQSRTAFQLGVGTNGSLGQQTGPKSTTATGCSFTGIYQHAMYVGLGSGNRICDCVLINVGNSSTSTLESFATATYPQVYFSSQGNAAVSNHSYRDVELSKLVSAPFIPSVSGITANIESYTSFQVTLTQYNTVSNMFRLPVTTNETGAPGRSIVFTINYNCRSLSGNYTRQGSLSVSADIAASISTRSSVISISDDYTFSGSSTNATKLSFSAFFLDTTGVIYTGAVGRVPGAIVVQYFNTLVGDTAVFDYTYCGVI